MSIGSVRMRFDERHLEIEELIAAVAKRHNILLSADDPIFMTVTLNELLLDRTLSALTASIVASQDQISAGSARYLVASKALGERLVTAATEHMLAQIGQATAEAADTIRAAARAELAPLHEAARKAASIRAGAWWALILSVATIAAAITLITPALSPKPSDCRLMSSSSIILPANKR